MLGEMTERLEYALSGAARQLPQRGSQATVAKAEEERGAVAEHKRPGRRTAPASRRESASIRGADGLDRGNGRG